MKDSSLSPVLQTPNLLFLQIWFPPPFFPFSPWSSLDECWGPSACAVCLYLKWGYFISFSVLCTEWVSPNSLPLSPSVSRTELVPFTSFELTICPSCTRFLISYFSPLPIPVSCLPLLSHVFLFSSGIIPSFITLCMLNILSLKSVRYFHIFDMIQVELFLLLSHWLMSDSFMTPWTVACQAPLSFSISWSLLRFVSIESLILSSYLIICRPLLLLPSIFPSIRVFSSELSLCIKWPKYWSFSFIIFPVNIQD